jgi:transposase-like protein
MARVEVITGPERRRRWSAEQKRVIVAESLAPGAVVTEIARRLEIRPGQIYRWRRQIGVGRVRVWLAVGHTDMRRGMNSLAVQVQEVLKRDPHAGVLYVFRGRRGNRAT